MSKIKSPRPLILCILDGWGYREAEEDNAIAQANTPVWDRLWANSPHALVKTSGLDVGLPEGQMGNSEVGHMNIGAGRVVMQDLPRIDQAVKDGTLAKNSELQEFIKALQKSGGACHLLGLLSPGGVHSHQDHMVALVKILEGAGIKVWLHAFLDGRDTPPESAKGFLEQFIKDAGKPSFATISGRYYAMDRDKRWDRVSLAYQALVEAQGVAAADALSAITQVKETDEFVKPSVIAGYKGMQDGDGLLMANFRADRAREILTSLVDPAFDGFVRNKTVNFAARLGIAEYSTALNQFFGTIFPPQSLEGILGEVVSQAGLTQLRIAETEKYAHVTFFLNGGEEKIYPGEERILIPSPKVATYDLQPEMSAPEVTDKLVEAINSQKFDLIIVNYANGDMVGHTGILPAAVKAAETVDAALGRLEAAIIAQGGAMLITADHGNAELMRDPESGEPYTAHTIFDVPLVLVNYKGKLRNGRLADIAPSLLQILGLPKPSSMSGQSLIEV